MRKDNNKIFSRAWLGRHWEKLSWGLTIAAATALVVMGAYIDRLATEEAAVAEAAAQQPAAQVEQKPEPQATEATALDVEQIPTPSETPQPPTTEQPQQPEQPQRQEQPADEAQEDQAGQAQAGSAEEFAFEPPLTQISAQRGWGYGYNANTEDYRFHRGVDLAAAAGETVYAAAAGQVEQSCADAYWGGLVILDHGNGWRSVYRCLTPSVEVGDQVTAGAALGQVLSQAPAEAAQDSHLHFEVEFEGESREPGYEN